MSLFAVFVLCLALIQIEGSVIAAKAKTNSQLLMNNIQHQIKAKEDELKNAENINKNFEKMIQLVNILGQVDSFLSQRTKEVIKKLALLVDEEKYHEGNQVLRNDDD